MKPPFPYGFPMVPTFDSFLCRLFRSSGLQLLWLRSSYDGRCRCRRCRRLVLAQRWNGPGVRPVENLVQSRGKTMLINNYECRHSHTHYIYIYKHITYILYLFISMLNVMIYYIYKIHRKLSRKSIKSRWSPCSDCVRFRPPPPALGGKRKIGSAPRRYRGSNMSG